MNGQHVDPAYDLEWGHSHGVISDAHRRRMAAYTQREARRKFVLQVIHLLFVIGVLGAFFLLLCGPAEARQRFVQRSSSACANGQCNLKQQAVVVHHQQAVVAAPVVHHAAPVVVEKVVQQAYVPPVQNFFYSVGQPLVQQSQMAAAVKSALAEHQFNATVNATIQGSVSGAQQFIQQPQPAAPAPQWTPPAEPQPPNELPTFSQTAPSAAQQACGECHGSGKAKGGFSIQQMTGEQFWNAVDRIKDGSMPPGNPLSAAAKEAVVKELLTLKP